MLDDFARLVNKSTGRIGLSRMCQNQGNNSYYYLVRANCTAEFSYKYQYKLSLPDNFLTPEFNYIFLLDSFQNNRNIYVVADHNVVQLGHNFI